MEKFIDGSLRQYLTDLSDRKIVPGGGSAAALVSAIGAGLNLMVINFCMGRKDCDGTIFQELEELKQEQLVCYKKISMLIDEDCDVFRKLMGVLTEKTDPQEAYKEAAGVPLEICKECVKAISISSKLVDKAGKHIVSDVGCSVNFLEAAFSSAKINVAINLKCIEDKTFVLKCEEELSALGNEIARVKEEVIQKLTV